MNKDKPKSKNNELSFSELSDMIPGAEDKSAYILHGHSMRPAFKPGDLVRIRRPDLLYEDATAKKGDIVLYTGNDEYVLHRVIRVNENSYTIAGDRDLWCENVPKDQVWGVTFEILRKGRRITKKDLSYRLRSRIYGSMTGFRIKRFIGIRWRKLRKKAGRIKRRIIRP